MATPYLRFSPKSSLSIYTSVSRKRGCSLQLSIHRREGCSCASVSVPGGTIFLRHWAMFIKWSSLILNNLFFLCLSACKDIRKGVCGELNGLKLRTFATVRCELFCSSLSTEQRRTVNALRYFQTSPDRFNKFAAASLLHCHLEKPLDPTVFADQSQSLKLTSLRVCVCVVGIFWRRTWGYARRTLCSLRSYTVAAMQKYKSGLSNYHLLSVTAA